MATPDKPLKPKEANELIQAGQFDPAALSKDVHHQPFKTQLENQREAMNGKGKGVDTSQAVLDKNGNLLDGTLKFPNGDTFVKVGEGWVWNTTKNGKPCQFNIEGMTSAVVDQEGNFTWKFADGRRKSVSKDGKFEQQLETVKVVFKDGRQPEFYAADEAHLYTTPGKLPTNVDHVEKIKWTEDDEIESITTGKEGATKLGYEGGHLNKISWANGKILKKKDSNHWEYVDAQGNPIEETDEHGQKKPAVFEGAVKFDRHNAHFEFINRPEFSEGGYGGVEGPPTITPEKIDEVLGKYHSPAAGLGKVIYDKGIEAGINPAYALAFFVHESSCGTAGVAKHTKSWGNIKALPSDIEAGRAYANRTPDGNVAYFRSYDSHEEGVEHWYRLMSTRMYKGKSLAQIIHKYAPNSDHNNEAGYVASVEKMVKNWAEG